MQQKRPVLDTTGLFFRISTRVKAEVCSTKAFTRVRWFVVYAIMVFNATFNNISVISWRRILLMEETRTLEENQ